MYNPFDFTGKKIIITGATSGIGRATAMALAAQGAQLCLVGRDEEKLIKTVNSLGTSNVIYYVKDLCEASDFEDMFNTFVADGKKIDGMVYSAAIADIQPLAAINKKRLDESMAVNFYSFIEMTKVFSKKKYHENGSIVGVSSIDVLSPVKCQTIYAATKAALGSAVNALAIELASKNIRINTVLPGCVNTEMMQKAIEIMSEQAVSQKLNRQILGISDPKDIANVIMYLLSDASSVITGRQIFADGGYINL